MNISTDLVTGAAAFLITVGIFSYAIGDNALFRTAAHLFVGVSAGYLASVAWWQVLWPDLLLPFLRAGIQERAALAVPLFGAALILMKSSPRLSRLGTPATAFLAGVSAAVVISGAITGTLMPQSMAAIRAFPLTSGSEGEGGRLAALFQVGLLLVGTISTLAYFHFGARTSVDGSSRRPAFIEAMAMVGSIFIATTLGVLFAGVLSAAVVALIDRIGFAISFLTGLPS